ncbi:imidazole glycerol phosphate synthase subunit HisH [Cohnella hashimotonis]|uniref:Imidazole glycerol phosphate synthase subunit HisH n=1 Tax=Cohnella hashimotonis TaxID=2826895 RepID=A0ABT6TQ20_9BACL|nr:imidazole glycerol phosphate synthase subunit HisH [Cohnella hashimotonis]MDI4648824.1 imidazole glycerol phosphate synthase subunit HisH [Cohnella hashimotonis]
MIAIVDYGMGNLHSVSKAVERLGREALVTSSREEILAADGVILPGVGAFGDAMRNLRETGLDAVVRESATAGQPLLGICLGMQLLFAESEEHGTHEGLGLLPGRVAKFRGDYKIPHMGWNELNFEQPSHPLFAGLAPGYVYFVHSFHALPERPEDLLATTDYHQPVTAIVGRDNVSGMQFHPEKSGDLGVALLRRFVELAEGGKA